MRTYGCLQGILLLLLLLLLVLLLLLPAEDCALSVTLRSTGCAGGGLFRAALASSSSSSSLPSRHFEQVSDSLSPISALGGRRGCSSHSSAATDSILLLPTGLPAGFSDRIVQPPAPSKRCLRASFEKGVFLQGGEDPRPTVAGLGVGEEGSDFFYAFF